MAVIKKKVWKDYFDAILSGKKKFEFRVADFDVTEGDILLLEEYDPETKSYTGRSIEKKVSYVGKFDPNSFGQKELIEKYGFYILSLD